MCHDRLAGACRRLLALRRGLRHGNGGVHSAGASRRHPQVSATVMVEPADARVATRRSGAHLLYLSRHADAFGRISVATLDEPDAPLVTASVECERSYFAADVGLCLTLNSESMNPRGFGVIVDRRFKELSRFPLAGLPIRARVVQRPALRRGDGICHRRELRRRFHDAHDDHRPALAAAACRPRTVHGRARRRAVPKSGFQFLGRQFFQRQ